MKILVSDQISEDALGILRKSGVDFEYLPEITVEELTTKIKDFDALVIRSRTKVSREILENGACLKIIGRAGVGIDNIDTDVAEKRGVRIVSTPDALTNAVAEFTIGLMIDLARRIGFANSKMLQGRWEKSALIGTELKGKTYGTIGIGRIGSQVSELAHSFGMKIIANDIIPIPSELIDTLGISVATQDQVFAEADFVDIHVPLTKETTYLVDYMKLKKMKRTAFLINTSRGKIVNEEDLLRALSEGLIAGAALDVFENEPNVRPDLLKNEKLVLTPHIAGQTQEAQSNAGMLVVEEVLNYLSLP